MDRFDILNGIQNSVMSKEAIPYLIDMSQKDKVTRIYSYSLMFNLEESNEELKNTLLKNLQSAADSIEFELISSVLLTFFRNDVIKEIKKKIDVYIGTSSFGRIHLKIAEIEGKDGESIKILKDLKSNYELDILTLKKFDELCMELNIDEKFSALKDKIPITEIEIIKKIKELEKAFDDFREERKRTSKISEDVEKMKGIFGKKEGDLLLSWGSLSKEIEKNAEHIQTTNQNLKDRIEDIQKNMRIYLIVVTAIFTALTGTFIGVLVHVINMISQLNS